MIKDRELELTEEEWKVLPTRTYDIPAGTPVIYDATTKRGGRPQTTEEQLLAVYERENKKLDSIDFRGIGFNANVAWGTGDEVETIEQSRAVISPLTLEAACAEGTPQNEYLKKRLEECAKTLPYRCGRCHKIICECEVNDEIYA